MRQIDAWHKKLTQQIQAAWQESGGTQQAKRLCRVELGLFACETLIPDESVESLWGMLNGYSLGIFDSEAWTDPVRRRARAILRALLPYYRGPYTWEEDIKWYVAQPAILRGYSVQDGKAQRRDVSVAANRFKVYEDTLQTPPPFSERQVRWAVPKEHYVFSHGRRTYDVTIPEDWHIEEAQGHVIKSRARRPAIHVAWAELVETAKWMDTQVSAQKYTERLQHIRLEMRAKNGFVQASHLHIDGLFHLAGMLSSGKTTLMQVLTVWAIKQGLHVTLVLGDVVSVLEWASLFLQMGINAAPLIGGYNRERHLNRLHRVESEQNPAHPLNPQHLAFRWLGTACALNGTLPEPALLQPRELPCTRLQKASDLDAERPSYYSCPLYGRCGVHQAQRDLVRAQVWVATPASLIYTRVPSQLNTESMRFGELVSQHSDLVLVDEADRVQTQLDNVFSPSEILAGSGGEPWLNQLGAAVENQIRYSGRTSLGAADVEAWMTVQRNTQLATDKLYALLLQKSQHLKDIEQNYFTGWTVWESLVTEILGLQDLSTSAKRENSQYQEQMRIFNHVINAPLGAKNIREEETVTRLLARIRMLLTDQRLEATFPDVQEDLKVLFPYVVATSPQWETWSVRFTFALVASVLSWGVDYLTQNWELVKVPLNLDDRNTSLFYNPPQDYDASILAAPMGNVLAFQYTTESNDTAGILRFFRISGVGRAWLLNLHKLFSDEGKPGAHVMLLSGTSWAGKSPLYHVQHPVDGVLRTPDEVVHAITEHSRFLTHWVFDESTNRHIHISGSNAKQRSTAFDKLVKHFTQPLGPTQNDLSRFEQERNLLPLGRQRLMILVGSYNEADYVRQSIERSRPSWIGKVLNLVRDDDSSADSWVGTTTTASLQRGQVARFSQTDAWILIAPLMAIERGHNILNDEGHAAIGAAYFWVRPHPRPDDLTLPIAAINAWAIENDTNQWGNTLLSASERFRSHAYLNWRHWLQVPWIYSTLGQNERDMVTWSQLVTIWQVIGRLVRGGSPARVHFVDAAFSSHYYASKSDDEPAKISQRGLLAEMKSVLEPYFSENTTIDSDTQNLVQMLYAPFYQALLKLGDV